MREKSPSPGPAGPHSVKQADLVVPLDVVAAAWKAFDLEGRRSDLDEAGLKIAENQEASLANRKQLADATKEFKRAADGAGGAVPAKSVGALLKRYQEEIDSLTKRAKHGEAAFLALYQQLYEAPDPTHALLCALESASRTSDLDTQVARLSVELAEYKAESRAIVNQGLTVRKLEEAVRDLTAQLEAKDEAIADAARQAAAEADAAVIAQMQEREAQLQQQLASARDGLAAQQRLHQSAQEQLFAMQARSEAEKAGVSSELELASAELERAQEQLAALERERASLAERKEAAEAKQAAVPSPATPDLSQEATLLRQELAGQREAVSRLRAEVAEARAAAAEEAAQWGGRLGGLQGQLAAAEQHAHSLEAELAARPTAAQLDELRQQVRILQAVGYGAVEGEDGGEPSASGAGGGGAGPGTLGTGGEASTSGGGAAAEKPSLEALLLRKSRRLEHELTMARLAVAEAGQQAEGLQAQVAELQAALAAREALAAQLEADLLAAQALEPRGAGRAASMAALPGGGGGGALARDPSTSGPEQSLRALPSFASTASMPMLSAEPGGGAGATAGGEEDGASSMVRVLSSQRDRFRARCKDLEEKLAAAQGQLAAAQGDLAAARADNVALVERLRFVHGYRQQQRQQAGKEGQVSIDVADAAGAEAERKYGALYDERINPFQAFQGRQQEQKRRQMSVPDRAMYSVGQLVYTTPAARLLAFLYLLALHLLVFSTLAHMSHRTSAHLEDLHHGGLLEHGGARTDLTSAMFHDGATGVAAHHAAAAAAKAGRGLLSLW